MTKIQEQYKLLKNSCATMKQKIHILELVIQASIAYGFYAIAFFLLTIHKLDKIIIKLQKSICGLSKSFSNVTTQLPYNLFGLNAFSLRKSYLRCIGEQLRDILNDPGILGSIYQGLTNYIFSFFGGFKNPNISPPTCIQSPTICTIYLLKTLRCIHLCNKMDSFHQNKTPLEIQCLAQQTIHPYITEQTSLHYIHKLYLLNITNIIQLTNIFGTKLMDLQTINTKFGKITNIKKKITPKASNPIM